MKKYSKIISVLLVLMLVFTFTACGDNSDEEDQAAEDKVYELAACWVAAESSPTIQSWYAFRDKIEKESNGRIKVVTYHTSQLGSSDRECAEKVATGVVQFASVPSATMAEFSGIKEYDALSIPYLCLNDAQLDYIYDNGVFDDVNEEFAEKTGMVPNGSFSAGWVSLGLAKGSARLPEDIKGEKIRSMTTDAQLRTLEAWGAAPTPMGFGEMFTGIQQRTIDGALAASLLFDAEGFGDILESVTDINPFATYHIGFYNKEWYDSLPSDLQEIFDECMEYFYEVSRENAIKATEESYDNLTARGCEIIRLTDEERAVWVDAAASVYDDMAENIGADFVKKVEDCLATMNK